jgi:hypothetical protein
LANCRKYTICIPIIAELTACTAFTGVQVNGLAGTAKPAQFARELTANPLKKNGMEKALNTHQTKYTDHPRNNLFTTFDVPNSHLRYRTTIPPI